MTMKTPTDEQKTKLEQKIADAIKLMPGLVDRNGKHNHPEELRLYSHKWNCWKERCRVETMTGYIDGYREVGVPVSSHLVDVAMLSTSTHVAVATLYTVSTYDGLSKNEGGQEVLSDERIKTQIHVSFAKSTDATNPEQLISCSLPEISHYYTEKLNENWGSFRLSKPSPHQHTPATSILLRERESGIIEATYHYDDAVRCTRSKELERECYLSKPDVTYLIDMSCPESIDCVKRVY